MDNKGVTPQGVGIGITADWVWDYFRDVDTLDPGNVTKHYGLDGTFRFANAAPVRGNDAITQVLKQFYGSIRDMKHRNTGLWLGDNSAVFEAEVHFVRNDGRAVIIPASSVLRLQAGKLQDFRMIMDASPISEAAKQ